MSVLIDRIPNDLLDALRTAVTPLIATSAAVLLDRLTPTVIDGTPENGYRVAFVFAEIAKQKIGAAELQAVYRAAADTLLTPQAHTVIADRVCAGVFYAVMAAQAERAIFWTTMLLMRAVAQRLEDGTIRALLDRLMLMRAIVPPADARGRFGHAVMLAVMSQAHARVGDYGGAADLLRNVPAENPSADDDEALRGEWPRVRLMISLAQAVYLIAAGRTGARDVIDALGSAEFGTMTGDQVAVTLEVLAQVVLHEGISEETPATLKSALAVIDPADASARAAAVHLAAVLGASAGQLGADALTLKSCMPNTSFGQLLLAVAEGTYAQQRGDADQALERLTIASDSARGLGWVSGPFWAELQSQRGEASYTAGKDDLATASFAESRANADEGSFTKAWSAWRLGLLREDVDAFDEAARAFHDLGLTAPWARALGARGAVFIKLGRDRDGLGCLAQIMEAYYVGGDATVAPAAVVAQAHLVRYGAQHSGQPKADDDPMFPAFGGSPYGLVLASAVPRTGPIVAFFTLAEAYRAGGDPGAVRRYLALAADSEPRNDTDVMARPQAVSALIGCLGVSSGDEAEIRRYFSAFLANPREADRDPLFALQMFASDDADGALTDGGSRLEIVARGLADGLSDTGRSEPFWEAEILAARARLARACNADSAQIARLWAQAMQRAIASQNRRVMLRAGLALGFEYAEWSTSMRQLAQHQYTCLRGAELSGQTPDFLGTNLFNFWRLHDYRRLSEKDLPTKLMLMDTARAMDLAGTRPEVASAAMVALLARLFDPQGPAHDWAEGQLRDHINELPEEVRRHLE